MIKIIGVRFRTAGKIYYFDPAELDIPKGAHVIVETARGIEYGTVVAGVRQVEEEKVPVPLKPVIRVSTAQDDERVRRNREREREAMEICREKIRRHGLEMKLIDAEYTFDNNKVLFYFTADGRVDFRELVKDLASVFRTRIELRQIGVRDETKLLGGIGICGRPLCCHAYLTDFAPVSIRMAKEQNLSLNPTKISGVCGRLMCCLKNEESTYEYLNSRLPGVGETVTTSAGMKGEVAEVNVLRQKVKVLLEVDGEKQLQEYRVDELRFKPRKRRDRKAEETEDGLTQERDETPFLPDMEEAPAQETASRGQAGPKGRGHQAQSGQQPFAQAGMKQQHFAQAGMKRREASPARRRELSCPGGEREEAPGETGAQGDAEKRRPRKRRRPQRQRQEMGPADRSLISEDGQEG